MQICPLVVVGFFMGAIPHFFECFSFIAKILLNLYRLRVNTLGGHILMKVFFAFVLM